MLVLVKELNEKFQRNIKVVLPIDLLLVSTKSNTRLSAYKAFGGSINLLEFTVLSVVTHSHICHLIKEQLIFMAVC